MDIGQSKRPTCVSERQPFMVDAQLMQDCGLDVMHMDRIFDGSEAEFIGITERLAIANPAPSHPH